MQKRRERTKRERRAIAICAAGTAMSAVGYILAGIRIAGGTATGVSMFLAGATAGLNIAVIAITAQTLREEREACIQH